MTAAAQRLFLLCLLASPLVYLADAQPSVSSQPSTPKAQGSAGTATEQNQPKTLCSARGHHPVRVANPMNQRLWG